MIYFQESTTYSSNITVSISITPHILHKLLKNTLQGTGKEYLNDILSKINHTTDSPTAYEPLLPRDWKGLSI